MTEWQQKGYDAWIELWVAHGCTPTATSCPARWMKPDSQERSQFVAGWNKAKLESTALPAALAPASPHKESQNG